MKKIGLLLMFFVFFVFFAKMSFAALTGDSVIDRVEAVVNAPKDQKLTMKFILIDSRGKEKVREAVISQKGTDKRLIKFTYPADQKGIAFLSLPGDVMYLYLPAFRRVRRIAAHIKNRKFAGTDFSYDDLSTTSYKKDYNVKIEIESDTKFILSLTPKIADRKEYSRVKMWVRKDIFYITRLEMYDKAGKLWKIMTEKNIVKVGKYWIAKKMEIHDLKAQHKTRLEVLKVEYDKNLPDKYFTQRYLSR